MQWTNRDSTTPEELLWKSVILQFFWDISFSRRIYDEALNGEAKPARFNLESHRTNVDHEWLCEICYMANEPYDKVRSYAYKILDGQVKNNPFKLRATSDYKSNL